MAIAACILISLAAALYMFLPERRVTAQREKTRLEYLEEQKAVLYDNLRDLRFEQAAGKYTAVDYEAQRTALETEAAEVVAEMDRIARRGAQRA